MVILSFSYDIHSQVVALSLRELGCDVLEFSVNDPLDRHRVALSLDGDGKAHLRIDGQDLDRSTRVWMRRPFAKRFFEPSQAHDADRAFATSSAARFFNEFLQAMEEECFQVNPLSVTSRFESKFAQLRLAAETGFTTAPSLMTNDAVAALGFAGERRAVCKPFDQFVWDVSDLRIASATVEVPPAAKAETFKTVRFCPAIFQELLPSDEEVRVVVIGETAIAAGLNWSNHDGQRLDWRTDWANVDPRRIDIPSDVLKSLQRFMQASKLRFGAFDFMVRDGIWSFLEVNTAGQWLWMDRPEHGLPILDCFVHYLADPAAAYVEPTSARFGFDMCAERYGTTLHGRDPATGGFSSPEMISAIQQYTGVKRIQEGAC